MRRDRLLKKFEKTFGDERKDGTFGLPRWVEGLVLEAFDEGRKEGHKEEVKRAEVAKHAELRKNAVPGLVSVIYGKRPVPKEDGEYGYAYFSDEPLNLGDIVKVPKTWLAKKRKLRGPQLATVVSTYSDYSGPTASIIEVVTAAKDRKVRKRKKAA